MVDPDRLTIALVGCGHMGRHHAAAIAADPTCDLVVAVDRIPDRARAIADRHGARAQAGVPGEVDAVVIATPTRSHAEVAMPLLDRGQWCLVEKPLAHTVAAARALASERCVVGHIERFNPAVRAAGPLRPRVVEARRIAPPTGRGEDVDVVLDLMIHDLDLVLGWMAPGAEITSLDATGVAVGGTGIDTASARLRSSCGLTASLLASRVADGRQRVVRCYEPGRFTLLDLAAGRASVDGTACPPVDGVDALTAQWRAFTALVRADDSVPLPLAAPGVVGLQAVALAARIGSIIREERR